MFLVRNMSSELETRMGRFCNSTLSERAIACKSTGSEKASACSRTWSERDIACKCTGSERAIACSRTWSERAIQISIYHVNIAHTQFARRTRTDGGTEGRTDGRESR